MNYSDLLDCAVAAARAAADHAMRSISRRNETIEMHAHDVKLALDLECQEIAVDVVKSTFPDHAILAEEQLPHPTTKQRNTPTGVLGSLGEAETNPDTPASGFQWIIDPIDGTVNFRHALPFWCTSVAVTHNGETVAGAIYAPVTDDCYTATIDEPSKRNSAPITVSPIDKLSESMILTGMDKDLDPEIPPFEIFRRIAARSQKARILGSAALDICRVASGQAEGYFESGIYIWDVAAAGLIVSQAGGKAGIICHDRDNRLRFVASNGLIHDELLEVISV